MTTEFTVLLFMNQKVCRCDFGNYDNANDQKSRVYENIVLELAELDECIFKFNCAACKNSFVQSWTGISVGHNPNP